MSLIIIILNNDIGIIAVFPKSITFQEIRLSFANINSSVWTMVIA